jgi:RNA-directed DNA polymerase
VENRLQDIATTGEQGDESGEAGALPPAFAVNRRGLPVALFTLRQKLYLKAKREPQFRFYALYDRIYRLDVLEAAWALVAANDGAPGVDGVSIRQIGTTPGGAATLVATLQTELRSKQYRPQAIRRVFIPKADGRPRPLGIPTVRDRVVQTAALLILEPIFEADFRDCSYGYRPARQAHEALAAVLTALREGDTAIYDADLAAYFDTIPHDKLMQCVARRVADRSVRRLLRQWLTAPVEDRDDDGRPRRRRPTQGTPQGGVISPLLANLYLHWFDVRFHRAEGPAAWAQARLIRYADDFVILARTISPRLPDWVEAVVEGWLGLTINRQKTRLVTVGPTGEGAVPRLHVSVRPRSVWSRPPVSGGGAVGSGRRPVSGGGAAGGSDLPWPGPTAGPDPAGQSDAPGLGGVFQLRVSASRSPAGERVCGRTPHEPRPTSESAALPSTGGYVLVQLLHDRVGSGVVVTDAPLPDSCQANLLGKPDAGNPPVRFDEGDQV